MRVTLTGRLDTQACDTRWSSRHTSVRHSLVVQTHKRATLTGRLDTQACDTHWSSRFLCLHLAHLAAGNQVISKAVKCLDTIELAVKLLVLLTKEMRGTYSFNAFPSFGTDFKVLHLIAQSKLQERSGDCHVTPVTVM